MTTFADRVRRGAARFEQRGPADWRERINLTILNMRRCRTCVVGQAFLPNDVDDDVVNDDVVDEDMLGVEAYDRGVQHLLERDEFSVDDVDVLIDLGFEERDPNLYDELTRAWLDYLTPTTEPLPTEEVDR